MALNVTESNAVNTVADYLYGQDRLTIRDEPPTDSELREAMQLLLKGAVKTLMAGRHPEHVPPRPIVRQPGRGRR